MVLGLNPLVLFLLKEHFRNIIEINVLFVFSLGMGSAKTKLLEQNIPASYLLLERRVREIAVRCQQEDSSPVIKDAVFRYKYRFFAGAVNVHKILLFRFYTVLWEISICLHNVL